MTSPLEPLRLSPGADLRAALQAALAERGVQAACVVAGIGSLRPARLRLASAQDAFEIEGDSESVADAQGGVVGGHVLPGCIVRTTAELLVAWLDAWAFAREHDAATGYAELVVRRDPLP
jgi:uncharacterized protein